MTTHHVYPPVPDHRPRKSKKRFLIPAAALLLGLVVGGAAAGTKEPEIRVEEKRVEVPVEKIVTQTVEKEVTPKACITALDLAQQGFTYSSESMGYMNDALQAAGRFDVAGLEAANAQMEVLNPKIQALSDPMRAAVTECRAK